MQENQYRSLAKSISWRITGTMDTVVISFLVTGEIESALRIGGFELFTKMLLYYYQERAWNRISFGKQKPADDYTI